MLLSQIPRDLWISAHSSLFAIMGQGPRLRTPWAPAAAGRGSATVISTTSRPREGRGCDRRTKSSKSGGRSSVGPEMRHELRHGELPSRGDHESEIVAGVQTEHRSSGSKRGPYDGMRNVGDRRRMGFRHGLHAGLVAPGEASSFGKGGHELPQRLSRRAEGSASGRDRVARSHEGDIHGQSPDGSSRALQRSGSTR
jgi:hypothetical protein